MLLLWRLSTLGRNENVLLARMAVLLGYLYPEHGRVPQHDLLPRRGGARHQSFHSIRSHLGARRSANHPAAGNRLSRERNKHDWTDTRKAGELRSPVSETGLGEGPAHRRQ